MEKPYLGSEELYLLGYSQFISEWKTGSLQPKESEKKDPSEIPVGLVEAGGGAKTANAQRTQRMPHRRTRHNGTIKAQAIREKKIFALLYYSHSILYSKLVCSYDFMRWQAARSHRKTQATP